MIWTKDRIVAELRRLHRKGQALSYNALSRQNQSLVSAAAYHFGSYRRAIETAGIDYSEVTRRPRWTRQRIIQEIKKARKRGEELHWSSVTSRRDELGKAAFAALQPRLFGTWNRALQAAGLHADDVSRYRAWNRDAIVSELRSRAAEGEPLNSGALQKSDPGLHAAAMRHFGSYDQALKAARIDPSKVRQRRAWTKEQVVRGLRSVKREGQSLADSAIRRREPALYGAAVRLFGSFTAARDAAGIKWDRRKASAARRGSRSGGRS